MILKSERLEDNTMLEIIRNYFNEHIWKEHPSMLERFSQTLPAIMMKGEKTLTRRNQTILGTYVGDVSFGIGIRIAADQEPNTAYQIIKQMNVFLDEMRISKRYPDFGNDIMCQRIQMSSFPTLANTNEDGSEDYIASFTVTFKKY